MVEGPELRGCEAGSPHPSTPVNLAQLLHPALHPLLCQVLDTGLGAR